MSEVPLYQKKHPDRLATKKIRNPDFNPVKGCRWGEDRWEANNLPVNLMGKKWVNPMWERQEIEMGQFDVGKARNVSIQHIDRK